LNKPLPIPEWQIKDLMILMRTWVEVSMTDIQNYERGDEVIIKNGILQGLRGTIIKLKGKQKLMITISALNFNIVTDINAILVEKINNVNTSKPEIVKNNK
jgi:transcription antitermination factor NusG